MMDVSTVEACKEMAYNGNWETFALKDNGQCFVDM
jgi:hypothetical protein